MGAGVKVSVRAEGDPPGAGQPAAGRGYKDLRCASSDVEPDDVVRIPPTDVESVIGPEGHGPRPVQLAAQGCEVAEEPAGASFEDLYDVVGVAGDIAISVWPNPQVPGCG